VGEIPLYFYVPMERFFDGMDHKNSKTQGGKEQVRKKILKKKKRKEWRKEKEEIFFTTYMEVPILVCSPSIRNALRATTLVQPSLMGTSPTT
jgi:hypothetical protein